MGFKVQCFKAQMAFDGFKIDLDLNIFMAKNPKKHSFIFPLNFLLGRMLKPIIIS